MSRPNAYIAAEISRRMKAADLCFMTMAWADFRQLGEIERVAQSKLDKVAAELLDRNIVVGYGRNSISFAKDRDFAPAGVTWQAATSPVPTAAQPEPALLPQSARKHRQNGQQAAGQSSSAAQT